MQKLFRTRGILDQPEFHSISLLLSHFLFPSEEFDFSLKSIQFLHN